MIVANVRGSGFGLYQYSAVSHAKGGTVIGKACDASANFYNPATLSDLTNLQFTVGFITEHPRGMVRLGPGQKYSMDPGFFVLPHFQLAAPLPWGLTLGFGAAPEFGLGTRYDENWAMAFSSEETTVQSFVLTPNLSYNITDDWSIGAGLRFIYFDFEQYTRPQAAANGASYGSLQSRLKGDNAFRDIGWQVGTRYKILDSLSVGLVYKSPIEITVDGKLQTGISAYDFTVAEMARQKTEAAYAPMGAYAAAVAGANAYSVAHDQIVKAVNGAAYQNNGNASADVEMPQSIHFGANWDITSKWHLGAAVSWTNWSVYESLVFNLPSGSKPTQLNWRDTWRYSISPSWDFAEDWTAILSYTYDENSCSFTQASTMLPPADRHILTAGLVWRGWKGLELALSYGVIFMDGDEMRMSDSLGRVYNLETCRGFCHAGGFSITYRF